MFPQNHHQMMVPQHLRLADMFNFLTFWGKILKQGPFKIRKLLFFVTISIKENILSDFH